jgi:hypothetical protein
VLRQHMQWQCACLLAIRGALPRLHALRDCGDDVTCAQGQQGAQTLSMPTVPACITACALTTSNCAQMALRGWWMVAMMVCRLTSAQLWRRCDITLRAAKLSRPVCKVNMGRVTLI